MTEPESPLDVPRASREPATAPTTTAMTATQKRRLLEKVAKASAAFEAARAALHKAVHAALERGASWAEIGAVLGVSRQAAFQRFGPKRGRRPEREVSEP